MAKIHKAMDEIKLNRIKNQRIIDLGTWADPIGFRCRIVSTPFGGRIIGGRIIGGRIIGGRIIGGIDFGKKKDVLK